MSATTLAAPIPMTTAGVHARPGLGRLVAVELRKMLNTRAGFWLQVATVAITVVAVIARSVTGEAADHTFASSPQRRAAAGRRAVARRRDPARHLGVVPAHRDDHLRAGPGALARPRRQARSPASSSPSRCSSCPSPSSPRAAHRSPGIDGTWSDAATLIGQSAVYLTTGMVVGVAFGTILLASTPAIVALSALPIAWTAVASLSFFADAAPWLDTRLALAPLHEEVLSATQWAQAGTALALWMLLPLLIGIWRITRQEVAS